MGVAADSGGFPAVGWAGAVGGWEIWEKASIDPGYMGVSQDELECALAQIIRKKLARMAEPNQRQGCTG